MRREKCSKKMICQVIALCLMVCTLILPTPVSANVIRTDADRGRPGTRIKSRHMQGQQH